MTGELAGTFQFTDPPCSLEAVHFRHLAVHQRQVESLALDGPELPKPVLDCVALHTALPQHLLDVHAIDAVVLSQ